MTDDSIQANFEFFNRLCGNIKNELTEPAEHYGNMANLAAKPSAKIVDIKYYPQVWEEDKDELHDLTEAELQLEIFQHPSIRLRGEGEVVVEHSAPNGNSFTIQDMIIAIEVTERKSRGSSEWLGGIDVHHIYFEGIHQDENGDWEIHWGS
jgi:hypothetical protein